MSKHDWTASLAPQHVAALIVNNRYTCLFLLGAALTGREGAATRGGGGRSWPRRLGFVKVLFPVQHGFAVYSKREMLIVGSEEEWLWIGIRFTYNCGCAE